MIFTDVLTAVNVNKQYYQFIPFFIKSWKKIFPDIIIHIILIADEIIDELKPYSDYIKLFKPIENVSTAFTAQIIRILYPALLKEAKGGILITDMDMLPMGKKYYTEQIKDISNDKFICYRPLTCVGPKEMVICYNIAYSNIWSDIFNIKNENDIINTLKNISSNNIYEDVHGGKGWCLDQYYLYDRTQQWNQRTNSLIILNNELGTFTKYNEQEVVIFNKGNQNFAFKMNQILEEKYDNILYLRLGSYINYNAIKYFIERDRFVDYHIAKDCPHIIIESIVDLL